MAAGLPVVVSDLPTIRPIVEEHAIAASSSTPKIHKKSPTDLNALLSDPKKAEAMGQRGLDAVHKQNTTGIRRVRALLAVYRAL